MLQNAYLLAKIGADTAENEQHFAKILPTDALWRLRRAFRGPLSRPRAPGSPRGAAPRRRRGSSSAGAGWRWGCGSLRLGVRVWQNWQKLANFANFSKFSKFSKPTRLSSWNFWNLAKFCKFYDICKCFTEFLQKLLNFQTIFCENFEIAAVRKDANLVELEKCCQTHIFLQNFVLIQPRTSPPKNCKILPVLLTLTPNP